MTVDATTFLHFNDVYNVENAPSFVTSVKRTRDEILLSSDDGRRRVVTVFSGDAFSPSIMSTVLRGEQMVPALNALDIDVACLGNHDLDFGIQEFRELKNGTNFPWLCSNAWDAKMDEPLGGCREYFVLDQTGEGGPKILFVGLVEEAWLDTLSTLDPQDVVYESPTDFVKRRVPELKTEHGPFDAVVAVTHMRMPNDLKLAMEAGSSNAGLGGVGVDIILGGHDHHYEDVVVNNVRVLNSGADFKTYTVVECRGRDPSSGALLTASRRVNISKSDAPDEGVLASVQQFKEVVDGSMDTVVGRTKVQLDARFSEIRTKETNISNFLAELMTRGTGADIAILNAGSIRADRFVEKGELTMRDLCDLLPMADELTVIEVTAERVLLALENGVSQYPAMEGRFPCVDGVRFAFDPSKPAGSRVVPGSVYVRDRPLVKRRHTIVRGQQVDSTKNGVEKLSINEKADAKGNEAPKGFSPLESDKTYSLVSKAYLISGKDGFEKAFVGAPVLRDVDECPLLPTLLRNILTELRTLEFWKGMTVEATVIKAATKFKRLARRTAADPYAIRPNLDGRILNVAEA